MAGTSSQSSASSCTRMEPLTHDKLKQKPCLTLNFAVVGADNRLNTALCNKLVKLSVKPEFRHCTAACFGSAEELAGVPITATPSLSVVVLDVASYTSFKDVRPWLETLRNLQYFDRVCIAVYNAHRVSQRAVSAQSLHELQIQVSPVPVFFHGPDKEKWQPLVSTILRWGEIAAGLRGSMTMQCLRGLMQQCGAP